MKASSDTFAIIREVMSLGQRQSIRYRMTGYAYLVDALGSRRVPYEREGALAAHARGGRPRHDGPGAGGAIVRAGDRSSKIAAKVGKILLMDG